MESSKAPGAFSVFLRFYVGDDAEKVADEIWSLEN